MFNTDGTQLKKHRLSMTGVGEPCVPIVARSGEQQNYPLPREVRERAAKLLSPPGRIGGVSTVSKKKC